MTSQAKRRWQFGLRWVFAATAGIGVYLSCWQATIRYGIPTVEEYVARSESWEFDNASSHVPLIVAIDEIPDDWFQRDTDTPFCKRYYLWLFVAVARLPYEHDSLFDDYQQNGFGAAGGGFGSLP